MKKNISYIILILILLIVAIVLFMKDHNGTLPFDYKEFSLNDTSIITSIRIHTNKTSLILDRQDRSWVVNQKYHANQHAINKLLGAFLHMEINSPVPQKLKKDIINQMNDSSLIVEIVSNGVILKKYDVMDSPLIAGGTLVRKAGRDDPYVIQLTGDGIRLSSLLVMNPYVWRERTVFHYQPGEIKVVEVEYPYNTASSFVLNVTNNRKIFKQSIVKKQLTKVSDEKVFQYFLNFQSVPFHWMMPERAKSVYDSINGHTPFCVISVTNLKNQVNEIKGYRIPLAGKPGAFNSDKLFVKFHEDSIPVIVKFIDLDPILKEYSDF